MQCHESMKAEVEVQNAWQSSQGGNKNKEELYLLLDLIEKTGNYTTKG